MDTYKHLQLHILIGCSDARDLSQLQLNALDATVEKYKKLGIKIEMHVLRIAGSFITPDVIADIKRIIEKTQRSTELPIDYKVHIQTHGHLTDDSNTDYISHVYDLRVVDGSPLNCGMLNASNVAIELEKLVLEEKPEIVIKEKKYIVDTETKLRLMLKEIYAHDGYLAGDWIKSIDRIRVHPRSQRTVLENAIKTDSDLKTLGIKITAGIQDYSLHSLIRVDDGEPAVPFWDDVQQYVRASVDLNREKNEITLKQVEQQKPLAGLICMSDPKQTTRSLAAAYYMKTRKLTEVNDYLPNTIFNITGSSFDLPHTPFGPYVIGGFFYAVKYLSLTDQMVMGYDENQTNRIMHKIMNDPLMKLVVNTYNVNLIPINQVDLL